MHKNGQNTIQGFILHLSNHQFEYNNKSQFYRCFYFVFLISLHFRALQKIIQESFHKNDFKVERKQNTQI